MRALTIALVLAVTATPALAGSKVGGGTPPPQGPCDAACEQAQRDAEKAAEAALANGSGAMPVTGGAPPKKPGASQGGGAPPAPAPSGGTGVAVAPVSARPLTSGDVSAVGVQPAATAATPGVTIPQQQAAPPVGPRPR